MKPTLLLLVRSQTGAAAALAEIGRRRATELGLAVEVVPEKTGQSLPASDSTEECVTAIVPVDFAVEQHEAWCLLCHLSLMRCDIAFSILVLGAESDSAFQARQRALLVRTRASSPAKIRRHNAA